MHPFSVRDMGGLLGPIIFLLGLYDDLRGADARFKFSVQAIAAGLLYFSGDGVEHFDLFSKSHVLGTVLGLPITVFCVLLVTNAFNLIDGLDGLAAGSAFFSTMVMFVIPFFGPTWARVGEKLQYVSSVKGRFLPSPCLYIENS